MSTIVRLQRALCVGLLLLGTARPGLAQQAAGPAPPPRPVARPAPPPPLKLGGVDVSINWRSRVEGWGWFEGDTGNSHYTFGHSLLRVGLGQKRDRMDWQIEASHVAILSLPDDATAPAPLGQLGMGATYYAANRNGAHHASLFVKQAFVQLKPIGPASSNSGASSSSTAPRRSRPTRW